MQQDSSAPMTQDCVWHWRNSDFMVSISYSILRLACRSSQASHCLNVPLTAMGHPPRESGNASSSRVVPTFESGNASSAPGPASRRMRTAHERRVRPIVQPPLSPISMPANLPEDSGSDLSSSPCVKRQRKPRQCLAPPFDPDSCGNHLKDGSRTVAPWGRQAAKSSRSCIGITCAPRSPPSTVFWISSTCVLTATATRCPTNWESRKT